MRRRAPMLDVIELVATASRLFARPYITGTRAEASQQVTIKHDLPPDNEVRSG